ncbi:hypothetical protein N806_18315 [Rhodococcus sp. P27]|nr:hypothetical protein N806_18315 [Rhodococcus sp. P27]
MLGSGERGVSALLTESVENVPSGNKAGMSTAL